MVDFPSNCSKILKNHIISIDTTRKVVNMIGKEGLG